MLGALLTGVALVLIVEGLVLALLPGRIEQALALLASMRPEQRRLIGLAALAAGTALAALAKAAGG
jgi:uncharacterized protein YjeT (DUF2065 family)